MLKFNIEMIDFLHMFINLHHTIYYEDKFICQKKKITNRIIYGVNE